VTVRYPLRLGPNVGKLHEDNPEKLCKKAASEAFTRNEVLAIADPQIYIAALSVLDGRGGLPELAKRERTNTVLDDPNGIVELFPSWDKADITPYVRVRGGAAKIGHTLHHARLYVVPSKHGPRLYQLRVFAGEFASIGFRRAGVDLFTAELPVWSQSYRGAPKALRVALKSGTAIYVGWLAPGDELEFRAECRDHVPALVPAPSESRSRTTLREPIRDLRWRVVTFEDHRRINLRPAYIAAEEYKQGALSDLEFLEGAEEYFSKYWRLSVSDLARLNPTVIRRTASGAPRWRRDGNLPVSWRLGDALERLVPS